MGAIVFDWPTMYVISLPEGKGATAAETYEFRVCEVKSRKSARHYRYRRDRIRMLPREHGEIVRDGNAGSAVGPALRHKGATAAETYEFVR